MTDFNGTSWEYVLNACVNYHPYAAFYDTTYSSYYKPTYNFPWDPTKTSLYDMNKPNNRPKVSYHTEPLLQHDFLTNWYCLINESAAYGITNDDANHHLCSLN
jgi:hypothetical protein